MRSLSRCAECMRLYSIGVKSLRISQSGKHIGNFGKAQGKYGKHMHEYGNIFWTSI